MIDCHCDIELSHIDWVHLHTKPRLTKTTGEALIQDWGDVCVIEDNGTLAIDSYIDYVQAYKLFRTIHGDNYDTVVFVSDAGLWAPTFCSPICNDVEGIGLGLFDHREGWGTRRLRAFIAMNMWSLPKWYMCHEFAHQWVAYARYKDPQTSEVMHDHLDPIWGHWNDKFNGNRSLVSRNMDGLFTTLDLYLMGLLPAGAVGEMPLIRDGDSEPVYLSIQDFIAADGERMPAKDRWYQAWIVLTKDRHKCQDLVQRVDDMRYQWQKDFIDATKGLGRICTSLR